MPERVTVLLMGFGCACWVLWLLGLAHERLSRRKSTTTSEPRRRQSIIKRGWNVLQAARQKRRKPAILAPPEPRVLTYQRRFPGFRQPCDASLVELW
jgi:hypothetical protein